MTKRVLFAANLESFFTKFLIPQLKYFKEAGYEVHIAAKSQNISIPYCDKKYDVDFARGFSIKQNIRSYKQMKKIFKTNHYDIVSCHTPFGAAITRLAFKNSKIKNTKMVYMNHGFHFYKGAPLLNWLLFYPIERHFAKYTDTLLTINLEDYELAKRKFKTSVKYVAGVGLDPTKFNFSVTQTEKSKFRKSLGIGKDDFVIIYPAEINKNKRQDWLIKTLKDIFYEHKNFHLLLPGNDSTKGKCQLLINKLGLQGQVHLLGFRNDIPKLLKISDLSVSSSAREGLPVNIMEAVYCGLPIVATDCRGNKDLIKNGKNGYIVDLNDSKAFNDSVLKLYNAKEQEKSRILITDKKIIEQYLLKNVLDSIIKAYE